ncbi:hypothetical protein HDZ31DRAFT_34621 [Schizophyllum fasciatum]
MHRCFYIPEILTLICEACREPTGDNDSTWVTSENTHLLAALARTCKEVYATAVRCLWQDVTDIAIIAEYTMPECWNWEMAPGDNIPLLSPTRHIVESDLTRFRFHAPFIRKMTFGGSDWPKGLSEDGYLALCMSYTIHPLFPNLTHISWDISGIHLLYLQYFVSPSLVSLHIAGDSLNFGDMHILRYIQQRCTNVTELNIGCGYATLSGETQAIRSIGDTLCSWSLRSLKTPLMDTRLLQQLAVMPSLRTLHVIPGAHWPGFTMLNSAKVDDPLLPPHSFSALTTLAIESDMAADCLTVVLRHCTFGSLQSLELTSLTPWVGWRSLFSAVRAAHNMPIALRRLKLKGGPRPSHSPTPPPVQGAAFEPLYDFCALEELNLELACAHHLEADDLLRMAQSWPRLRMLKIRTRTRPFMRPPLHALRHFALYCPRLSILRLEVDAVDIALAQTPTNIRHIALRQLAVDWAPIASAGSVAAYLSAVFPNIERIKSKLNAEEEDPMWRKASVLIKAFRAVRAHENLCIGNEISGRIADIADIDGIEF